MNDGAKKDSSEKASNYVQMDKIYVDKLLNVVRNKWWIQTVLSMYKDIFTYK